MKNLLNLFLAIFSAIVVFSCRGNDVPEDIHDHDGIEKTTLTITEKSNPSNVQVVDIIGGTATRNVILENGKVYTSSVEFFTKHDNHYDSAMKEIQEERDEHFITYQFAGVSVNVIRTNNDIIRGDGKKLGVKTEWTVTNAPTNNAVVNLKLYHKPTSVNDHSPSAANQLGSVTGGSTDVDVKVNLR